MGKSSDGQPSPENQLRYPCRFCGRASCVSSAAKRTILVGNAQCVILLEVKVIGRLLVNMHRQNVTTRCGINLETYEVSTQYCQCYKT